MPVMKSGRTTGFTTGTITATDVSVSIQYQKGCNAGKKFTITFTNQIATTNMSAGGDSGSLLVSDDGSPNPVGLLYAGSSSVTIHNPIQDVVNAFTAGGHTFSFAGNSCGGAAAAGEAVAVARPSDDDLNAALQVKVEHENDLFRIPGVLGVGLGAAEDDPEAAAIVVFFESPRGVAPKTLPTELEGTKVRVILTDTIVAQ
jgi:hypothetical protein